MKKTDFMKTYLQEAIKTAENNNACLLCRRAYSSVPERKTITKRVSQGNL